MSLWVNMRRDKIWVDIFYKGEKIASVRVDDKNVGNRACIAFDSDPSVTKFKVIRKEKPEEIDEGQYNREEFNK